MQSAVCSKQHAVTRGEYKIVATAYYGDCGCSQLCLQGYLATRISDGSYRCLDTRISDGSVNKRWILDTDGSYGYGYLVTY